MKRPNSQLSLFDSDEHGPDQSPIEEHYSPVTRRRLAPRAARRKFEEQLCKFMGADYAAAVSRVVVDPENARKRLQAPTAHHLQGGTLYTIEVDAWTCGVLPFPANPRTSGAWRYPVAGEPGAGAPVPPVLASTPGLVGESPPPAVDISIDTAVAFANLVSVNAHAIWVTNNLMDSISHQGILNAVLGVVGRVILEDGTTTYVVFAADGSSRITSAQRILEMDPAQSLYPLSQDLPHDNGNFTQFERYVQDLLREVDEIDGVRPRSRTLAQLEARQRALICPMTVVVGWEPSKHDSVDFLSLVRSKIGLVHVSGAKQWDLSSQSDAMADSVIDTLARAAMIDESQRRWLSGRMSPEEAELHALPHLPDEWFVAVCATILAEDNKRIVNQGIRQMLPAGSRSNNDRIGVAVEVALRQVRSVLNPDMLSRARVTLVDVLRQSLFTKPEAIDGRRKNRRLANILGEGESVDELLDMALAELELTEDLARRRLVLLALLWMVTTGLLVRVDGRSEKNPVRPATILRNMSADVQGLRILHRTILDARAGRLPRLVDKTGAFVFENGREVDLTAGMLRDMYADAVINSSLSGEIAAAVLPADQLRHLADRAAQHIRDANESLELALAIESEDGEPLIERFGLELTVLETALRNAQQVQGQITEAMSATKRIIRRNRAAAEAITGTDETEEVVA